MSRMVKVVSPNNGNGWYWEVRTLDGVIARGLCDSRADADDQAEDAQIKAENDAKGGRVDDRRRADRMRRGALSVG
jgi:hypothetical protein